MENRNTLSILIERVASRELVPWVKKEPGRQSQAGDGRGQPRDEQQQNLLPARGPDGQGKGMLLPLEAGTVGRELEHF